MDLKFARCLGLLALLAAAPAPAQELKIGYGLESSSIDPHFHNIIPNISIARHIFDALFLVDKQDRVIPGLAESWNIQPDGSWEMKLRRGVRWHDGSPFTADDVVFSMERATKVANSPGSFVTFIGARKVEKIDDFTIRVRTPAPDPMVPNNLAAISIVSAKHGREATTEDYNTGKAAIGTGPFKFVDFVPGERVTLVRNDDYWGPKPAWTRVVFRPIKSNATRLSALLAGDIDVIDGVPTTDVARLRKTDGIEVASTTSGRFMFLHMDRHRAETPFITAKDGGRIANPLNDLRVRQAMSLAINRQAIVDRIMEGEGEPAGQYVPGFYAGASEKLKPQAQNLDRARALLAEAGLPNGFRMSIHGPAGRYPNDVKVVEALAQMFARIGIDTRVETLPPPVFFTRASTGGPGGTPEFSVMFWGGAGQAGDPSPIFISLIGTYDRERGWGATNRGRYSNPSLDSLVVEAMGTMDDARRTAMFQRASEIAVGDLAMIPIYFQKVSWASKRSVAVEARADETMLAAEMRPR